MTLAGNVRIIAHRGWSARFPENTLPSFAAAIAAGADELELDVRVSKDGVPIICHDADIDRVSGQTGFCNELTLGELQSAGIRMLDGSVLAGTGFHTLEEVLQLFGGQIGLNIHIKSHDAIENTLDVLRKYEHLHGREDTYIAGDDRVVKAARRVCPDMPRCYVAPARRVPDLIERAVELECARLQFFVGYCEPEDIKRAATAQLLPNFYFADSPEDAEAAVQAGVIGLLTNDVGPVGQHLQNLGIWRPAAQV